MTELDDLEAVEYTPTTEEVREIFVSAAPLDIPEDVVASAFDRWLAAHDEAKDATIRKYEAAVGAVRKQAQWIVDVHKEPDPSTFVEGLVNQAECTLESLDYRLGDTP